MKRKILDTTICEELEFDYLEKNIQILSVNESNLSKVEAFLINNQIMTNIINLNNSYFVQINTNNENHIIGLFVLEENYVGTKFSQFKDFQDNRHFVEITSLVIDRKLINKNILHKCFNIILPLIITTNKVDDVIWYEYKGILYSQIIELITKDVIYYFQNETEYFADKLIHNYESEKELSQKLLDKIN